MSQPDEDQLIDDEAVQAIIEEIFKEARRPLEELGDAGRNNHIDFLEETISSAYSYLDTEVAVEIFEEVFEKPPLNIKKNDDNDNQEGE
jgi:hypothetical protein